MGPINKAPGVKLDAVPTCVILSWDVMHLSHNAIDGAVEAVIVLGSQAAREVIEAINALKYVTSYRNIATLPLMNIRALSECGFTPSNVGIENLQPFILRDIYLAHECFGFS